MKLLKIISLLLYTMNLMSLHDYRPLNLILILDTNEDTVGGALASDFGIALAQKAAPIIVSENIVYNFFALRQSLTSSKIEYLEELQRATTRSVAELQKSHGQAVKNSSAYYQQLEVEKNILQKQNKGILDLIEQLSNTSLVASPASLAMLNAIGKHLQLQLSQIADESIIKRIPESLKQKLETLKAALDEYLNVHEQYEAKLAAKTEQDLERAQALSYSLKSLLDKYEVYAKTFIKELPSLYKQAINDFKEDKARIAKKTETFKHDDLQKTVEHHAKINEITEKQLEFEKNKRAIFYKSVPFDSKQWDIFKHVGGPIYLFVPKEYSAQVEKEFSKVRVSALEQESKELPNYSQTERALGLAINNTKIMQQITVKSEIDLFTQLQTNLLPHIGLNALMLVNQHPTFNLEALKELFIPKKLLPNDFWNIYATGHGNYNKHRTPNEQQALLAHKADQTQESLQLLDGAISLLPDREVLPSKQEQDFFNNQLNTLFISYLIVFKGNPFDPEDELSMQFLQAVVDGENNQIIQELVKHNNIAKVVLDKSLLKNFLKVLYQHIKAETKQEVELKVQSPSTAQLVGLTIEQFKEFLLFLNRSVNTSFLYYVTCFGGGMNAEQIRSYLENLEKNGQQNLFASSFIVVAGAVTDAEVVLYSLETPRNSLNFSQFFADLQSFFVNDKVFKKDPIITILNNVTMRTRGPKSLQGLTQVPLVYIPGTHLFRATQVDKEIFVLTNAKLKALELVIPKKKEKIEPLNLASKSALLFYPATINVPVLLGTDNQGHATALVPMETNQSVFKFNEINAAHISLAKFLRESIMDVRSIKPRTFLIQRLLTTNYKDSGLPGAADEVLALKNVSISSTIMIMARKETINWDIKFTYVDQAQQETIYHGTMQDDYGNAQKDRDITQPTWEKIIP